MAATGALRGDHGTVTIDLVTPSNGQATRPVTVVVAGSRCHQAKHCVRLTGRLTGTLTVQPRTVADIGAAFAVSAAGRLAPLGHVSATGTAQGTGFVAQGHEGLVLTLATRSGTVKLDAMSGLVRGFTSP